MAKEQDQRIGAAVVALRGDKTQQAVAASMRERGWKWSQATVWSVEKGDRPLRLAEASDLAGVFGCAILMLLQPPETLSAVVMLEQATFRVRKDFYAVFSAAKRLGRGLRELKDCVAFAVELNDSGGLQSRDGLAAWETGPGLDESIEWSRKDLALTAEHAIELAAGVVERTESGDDTGDDWIHDYTSLEAAQYAAIGTVAPHSGATGKGNDGLDPEAP